MNPISSRAFSITWGWQRPITEYTYSLWARDWNLAKNDFGADLYDMIMIQSFHICAHAPAAELSWHVQKCDMIGTSFYVKVLNTYTIFGS